MLSKNFLEMMEIDVSPFVKERDGVQYLPWASCLYLLYKEGAEIVEFSPVPGPDGHTLRKTDREFQDKSGNVNMCYEIVVRVQVDNREWLYTYPVINSNNPVKDNSLNQNRVHAACRRAFVKCVAERTGLGFNLWLKEDDLPDEPAEDLTKHKLSKCKQRLLETVTNKINAGLPLSIMADRLGMDEDTLRAKFSLYNELARLEKAIGEMQV